MDLFLCDVHASETDEQVRLRMTLRLGSRQKFLIKLSGAVPGTAGAILASLRAWTAQKNSGRTSTSGVARTNRMVNSATWAGNLKSLSRRSFKNGKCSQRLRLLQQSSLARLVQRLSWRLPYGEILVQAVAFFSMFRVTFFSPNLRGFFFYASGKKTKCPKKKKSWLSVPVHLTDKWHT